MIMRQHRTNKAIIFSGLIILLFAACKKYSDTPGLHTDPRFERKYCNVPDAVNYNWNFPGTPDSSDAVCYYPSDIFKGNLLYTDSIYDGNSKFVREEVKTLHAVASTHTQLIINGFCPSSAITFLANRTMHADADSNTLYGQLLCRNLDTLSGYIYKDSGDSLRILFALRVGSDTGVYFHRGSAVKQ